MSRKKGRYFTLLKEIPKFKNKELGEQQETTDISELEKEESAK